MSRSAFRVAVDIDAPPEKVFALLCDVERWPEWTPTMTRVQRLDQGPFAVSSSAQIQQREGVGSRVELSFEISGLMGLVIYRLYGGLIEEYVTTESRRLKQRVESAAT
jgi:uncharacterized membrane protein